MNLHKIIEAEKLKAIYVSGNNTRYCSGDLYKTLSDMGFYVSVTAGETRHDFDVFTVSNGEETVIFNF